MRESSETLEMQMDDPEFRHAYAASFMNASIAAQIKTIREQREWTQAELAERIGTKQAGISRLENVNYDAWKVETLTRIAKALDLRLRISFEEFDSLIDEIERFGRVSLERHGYENTKVQNALPRETEQPSDNLLEALNPSRKKEPQRNGEKDAPNSDSTGKSLRVHTTGGANSRNENFLAESNGISGESMPVSKEPEYIPRTQTA